MSILIGRAEAGTPTLLRAMRAAMCVVLVIAATIGLPSALPAQNVPQILVTAPTLTTPATVRVVGVLADKKLDELMRNAFPVHIHVRAEMWRTGRVFDELVTADEWELIIGFDTFDSNYEVVRVTRDSIRAIGAYKKLADARAAAEAAYAPHIGIPPRGRESYVSVRADVETMQMSDLEEVQRWLNGEARPAVQGKKNPGTAIVRGLRSLVTRLLGAEVRHLDGRTKPFTL